MIENENFSNQIIPKIIDTEYKDCNFSHSNCLTIFGQKVGHRIFPDDDTPRTFIDCNLTNCEPPPGSTQISSPSKVIEKSVVIATETIEIDGDVIVAEIIADRYLGRYWEGVYTYFLTPRDIIRRPV